MVDWIKITPIFILDSNNLNFDSIEQKIVPTTYNWTKLVPIIREVGMLLSNYK